ncbi:hypothetical protein [Xenophilus sp. Marseille-Q4582]|uniref:hypothetical protein n=1 Tax=Xenophilus sp. Marseille-Q4582 TaxID=2866600 RepID=UPI001CE46362|nr:hypothetical protein [Xenophilus sp. Marseille-Q4582]
MTRTHAARQLLALGPLTMPDFVVITGWPRKAARKTLAHLVEAGHAVYIGTRQRGIYAHHSARASFGGAA